MNTKIEQIAEAIASKRSDLFNQADYDKITDLIFWAWENWEPSVLATYYSGEKPAEPNYQFRKHWVSLELEGVPENYAALIASFKG
jgi:hypothetical protein